MTLWERSGNIRIRINLALWIGIPDQFWLICICWTCRTRTRRRKQR